MNVADSKTGHLQIERKPPADATDANEAFVYPRGTDGTDVWQRSAADAEMDADDAVVYPDGTDGTQLWGTSPERS